MKEEIKTLPHQIEEALNLSKDIEIDSENLGNIIISGMGASSIAGDVFKNLCAKPIPIQINKSGDLPPMASDSTLFAVISYSGNTEEALEILEEAHKKDIAVLAVTSGGKMEKICQKRNTPLCKIPKGIEPRSAIGYLSFALLGIMENSAILSNIRENAEELIKALLDPNMQFEEAGKQIARLLKGKIPVIYSPYNYSSVSYRWKTQINENAKQPAFAHVFPELFHNELESFEHNQFPLHIIILKDPDAPKKQAIQIIKLKKILEKKQIQFSEIEMLGNSPLEKIFLSIHLGDWTSYYLGVLNGVETKKVELIENFKK